MEPTKAKYKGYTITRKDGNYLIVELNMVATTLTDATDIIDWA